MIFWIVQKNYEFICRIRRKANSNSLWRWIHGVVLLWNQQIHFGMVPQHQSSIHPSIRLYFEELLKIKILTNQRQHHKFIFIYITHFNLHMYAVFKLCTGKCRFQSGKLKTTSNGNNHMFNHNLTRLRNGSSNSILYTYEWVLKIYFG